MTTTISTKQALQHGFGWVFRHKRIVLAWWLANVMAVAALTVPLMISFHRFFGKSLESGRLSQRLSIERIAEWFVNNPSLPFSVGAQAAIVLMIYMLVSTFLLSGTLAMLLPIAQEDGKASFWGNAGRYFPRLLRVMLLSLLVYGIALFGFRMVTSWMSPILNNSINERTVALLTWLKLGILGAGWLFLKAYFDVLKLILVRDNTTKVLRNLWKALRTYVSLLVPIIQLALYIALLSGLIWWLGSFLAGLPGEKTAGAMLAVLLIHQFVVILRIGMRLGYYGSVMAVVSGGAFGGTISGTNRLSPGPERGESQPSTDMPDSPPGSDHRHATEPIKKVEDQNQTEP